MQRRILFFFLTIFLFASVTACGANQTEPGATTNGATTNSPNAVATITKAAVAVVPTAAEKPIKMEPTAVPPTLAPTSTSQPSLPATNTPLPETTLAAITSPTAVPLNVNGIPVDQIIVTVPGRARTCASHLCRWANARPQRHHLLQTRRFHLHESQLSRSL